MESDKPASSCQEEEFLAGRVIWTAYSGGDGRIHEKHENGKPDFHGGAP